jgi:site-specific DNA recombinase
MTKKAAKSQPQETMAKVYVGYCRVSTDEQADSGYGLDAQEAKVRAYAAAMGYQLAEVIVDDGYSGASLDRPGLACLLNMLEAGDVAGVIVSKLDRLSRSLRNLLNIYGDYFEETGTALISVAEQFDTSTAAGRLFFSMIGGFAEFERDVITERMSGGRKAKAVKGGYAGGGAPIGYVAERGSKRLSVDHEKVDTVRRVFELHNQSLSLRTIADKLNAEGHTTATGAAWQAMQVKRVVDRRHIYQGGYSYAGVVVDNGQQEAILN